MESQPSNPTLLLFYVRHSERLDKVKNPTPEEREIKYPHCDSPLTIKGKQMAVENGEMIKEYLEKYDNGRFKGHYPEFISSPKLRCLQTAGFCA